MPMFVIQCENMIVERGEIEIEADTADEALAMVKDSDARSEMSYWFSDTVGSIDRVEIIDGVSCDDVEDPSSYKVSIRVDDFSYIAPYSHVALAEVGKED